MFFIVFNLCLLFFGAVVAFLSFIMSQSRFLSCLIVAENINVLLLLACLVSQSEESRVLFLALMVIFTIEATLGLVVLARLWCLSYLIDIVGF